MEEKAIVGTMTTLLLISMLILAFNIQTVYSEATTFDAPTPLTATDKEQLSDSQPLAGAIPWKITVTHKVTNFTKNGDRKIVLHAWAVNLDTRPELIRVDMEIWMWDELHIGAICSAWQWIDPADSPKAQFVGQFDILDPKWGFVGAGMSMVEYTVRLRVYYADYFIDGDPNNPHWAETPDAPEVSTTFVFCEAPPVPVIAYTVTGTVVTFDASGSYDADEKWGDYVTGYRWQFFDLEGNLVQLFGEFVSFDFGASGETLVRLKVEDMFGVRRQTGWTPVTIP